MGRLAVLLLALAASWVLAAGGPATPGTPAAGREVLLLRVAGPIGPASAGYVERGLRQAAERRVALVVLELDTPGGLDIAMRDIIKGILASPVPVATYVAPSGSRAASAGTYILYASHIAAMAPATTLGAATPIAIGLGAPGTNPEPAASGASGAAPAVPVPQDTLERKRVSDAAAYMRSLAQLRGRNADWGERAVREAVSLPSNEALTQHVVDALASDVPDLLRQVDGRSVRLGSGADVTLATAGARVVAYDPDWRDRLLAVIGDPNLALLLMLAGFYGLLFEFSNPGMIAPGVIGGVCLLLGLYGLQTLPISAAGIALLALGLGFFAAEAFVPSHGALGIGGFVAFGVGAVMLIDSRQPGFGVSPALVVTMALAILGLVVLLGSQSLRARRRPPSAGTATLVGAVGEVMESSGHDAWVQVQGERWQARCAHALRAGERVCVKRVDGLVLEVEGAA